MQPPVSIIRRAIAVIAMCTASSHAVAVDGLQPSPIPAPVAAADVAGPPVYVAEPMAGDAFAAIPVGLGDGLAPAWPRWFAGATMQPLGGMQLTTADAGANWPGGIDLRVGRWFGMRQQHAVELIYWGVYQLGGTADVSSASASIEAIPQASGVSVGGQPAADYLTNLGGQQISRADVVNDVEINWVPRVPPAGSSGQSDVVGRVPILRCR
jgi:hypothetical protein